MHAERESRERVVDIRRQAKKQGREGVRGEGGGSTAASKAE